MNPILSEIGTVFIPVRDVATSRDWYCQLFDLSADGDILFGHLYVVPLNGPNLVLDSKIFSELAESYVSHYCEKTGTHLDEVLKWLPILAAARLSESVDSNQSNYLYALCTSS